MNTFTAKATLGIALALLTLGNTGCATQSKEQGEASKMGAEMQKSGVMSQADYVKIRTLGHQVSQIHTISDADLDLTLGFMGKAQNAIARARALTTLSKIHPMSAAQKAKITPAIAPYLTSTYHLDQIGAQRVQKALTAGS